MTNFTTHLRIPLDIDNAVMRPIAKAVQMIPVRETLHLFQLQNSLVVHADQLVEMMRIERDAAIHQAQENSDMLTDAEVERDFVRAQLECAKADLRAAQAKIKRLEHSADYWRNLWVIANRNLYTAQKFIGLLIGVLGMLLVLWGVV